MSKEAGVFFDQFQHKLISGLNTCAIGKIIAFDETKLKADVELLPDGDLVKSVPVAMPQTSEFIVRMPYKPGDMVVVVFAHRDIDAIVHGGGGTSGRMLAIDDAIVVGGINLFSNSLPSGNDLVIAKKDFSSKIILGKDGKIDLSNSGGATVTLGTNGTINIIGPNGVTITGASTSQSF